MILDAETALWGASHEPAAYNEYGSVVEPGYKVEASNDEDTVRIEHKLPEPDLTDPGRMGTDERYLARLAAHQAYAVDRVVESDQTPGNSCPDTGEWSAAQ